jgi:hypothetical protein
MIPDLQASLLCDDVRQERNGKFILIGLFDGLAVQQLPTRFHRICVVNRWCCGQGQFQQKTRIVGTDGQTTVVEGKEIAVNLPDANHTATSIEAFMNTLFEKPGAYWIEVLLNGQLRLRYPLILRTVEPHGG